MRFATSILVMVLAATQQAATADTLRESVLRSAAQKHGLRPTSEVTPEINLELSKAGSLLFDSELMSLTRNVSCRSCHLAEFGSADGLPLGHGAGGVGKGVERIGSGAGILARNTLPLWGRGSIGFDTFFWDGRVEQEATRIISPFGMYAPSEDLLTVLVHMPPVEFREMVGETAETELFRAESLDAANLVYSSIVEQVRGEPEIAEPLSSALEISLDEIEFLDIAQSIAEFIRDSFRLRDTRFHNFVFGDGELNTSEIEGGLIFYGRGMCVSCHSGPFFSDLKFHSIPFRQFGFGKNGFGVDYGRYNVTLNPSDLYKFRTPPLYNVAQTSPYSHSGSVIDLATAIRVHVDPLWDVDTRDLSTLERAEIYARIARWSNEPGYGVELMDDEINDLVAFLRTLDFLPQKELPGGVGGQFGGQN